MSAPLSGDAITWWRDRNVFVTGATGLLGSWVVEELLARNAHVVCLVRDWVPESRMVGSGLLERTTVVRGELEDADVLTRSLNEYEINTVMHLGAQTTVDAAGRSPIGTFEANIRGSWNVLEACRLNSKTVERVVIASSDKAYGEHDQLPYTEDAPLQGKFPYDVSKSCTDLLSLAYFHSYGTPVAITRCGNLFGGGDLNFNRLIPGTIRSVLRGEPPIVRSDGTYVRDYFYVRDAADAYLLLAERLTDSGVRGEAFNFGTETPMSVLDMVHMILRMLDGSPLEPIVLNEASREIPKQYLDCSKARRVLNWRPKHTLEEGLSETISWYKEHLGPKAPMLTY